MSAITTASPVRGATATTVPSGATIWLSPAPCSRSTGTPTRSATIAMLRSGTRGPTLLAATTHTLFSTARTGTWREASSRANELRLLSRTWAPSTASIRGVSLMTPSMQE